MLADPLERFSVNVTRALGGRESTHLLVPPRRRRRRRRRCRRRSSPTRGEKGTFPAAVSAGRGPGHWHSGAGRGHGVSEDARWRSSRFGRPRTDGPAKLHSAHTLLSPPMHSAIAERRSFLPRLSLCTRACLRLTLSRAHSLRLPLVSDDAACARVHQPFPDGLRVRAAAGRDDAPAMRGETRGRRRRTEERRKEERKEGKEREVAARVVCVEIARARLCLRARRRRRWRRVCECARDEREEREKARKKRKS